MKRQEIQNALTGQTFDVLVIGGGATGLGTALDAVSRGLNVAVVEQADFAKGTSAKSTKLVHGGVRYLQQMNFKLVREALLERQSFYENAPHLSHAQAYTIPCYDYFSMPFYFSGLKMYDALAGFPKGQTSSMRSRQEMLQDFSGLQSTGLKGGVQYFDGIFNDSQMAVALARTINEKGGHCLNYIKVVNFLKQGNKLIGAMVEDQLSQQQFEIKAHCIINCTGVFSDEVRKLDEGHIQPSLTLAQGVHLVSRNTFGLKKAMLIPKTKDGRVLFAVPWMDVVVLGTTDTKIDQVSLEPAALAEEVSFILEGIRQYFPDLKQEDLLGLFTGIRPLAVAEGVSSAKTSREERIHIADSGLLSVVGGKWTTYRYMGEKIIDHAIQHQLIRGAQSSLTRKMPLSQWLPSEEAHQIPLCHRHLGSAYNQLSQSSDFKIQLHDELPYTKADLNHALDHELIVNIEDFLARRTRALYINPKAAVAVAPQIAKWMAEARGYDESWQNQQVSEFTALANQYYILDRYL